VNEVESSALGEAKVYEEPVDSAWLGKRVEYAVVYENGKGRESPLSPIARIEPVVALETLEAPKAEAADGFVALSWTAPANPPPGMGFSVHRRLEESKGYPERPLNSEPLSAASFEDRTAVFGVASCYVVAAVLAPSNVSSPPSEETCITPQDHFPPGAPKGLVAVPTENAILLSWQAVSSTDLKGYRVYRGATREGAAELIAEVTQPSYTDESAAVGETHYYSVTAIDNTTGTNESAKSEAVEAIRN
jgi:hypothetical protein